LFSAPHDEATLLFLSSAYLRIGDFVSAAERAQALLTSVSDRVTTRHVLTLLGTALTLHATCALEAHDPQAALAAVQEASRAVPGDLSVYATLGEVYRQLDRLDDALNALAVALDGIYTPKSFALSDSSSACVDALAAYAEVAWSLAQHTQAFTAFATLLALRPGHIKARQRLRGYFTETAAIYSRAIVAIDSARFLEAKATIQSLSAVTVDSPLPHVAEARLLAARGDYLASSASYTRARDASAALPPAVRLVLHNSLRCLSTELTTEALNEEIACMMLQFAHQSLDPRSTASYDPVGAVEALTVGLQNLPDDRRLLVARGDAQHDLKRYEQALASYTVALQVASGDDRPAIRVRMAAVHADLAQNALGVRRLASALSEYEQCFELDPHPRFAVAAARVALRLKLLDSAFEFVNKALAIDPRYRDAVLLHSQLVPRP
jgi:tetratricopeptide (TPR) repeat protein